MDSLMKYSQIDWLVEVTSKMETPNLKKNHLHRSLSLKITKNLGMTLLGIWLIITGLFPLLNLSFSWLGMLMAIVAIAAGALILAGK